VEHAWPWRDWHICLVRIVVGGSPQLRRPHRRGTGGNLCCVKDNYVVCVSQDGDGATMVLEWSTR
jgi:hypothetical protein